MNAFDYVQPVSVDAAVRAKTIKGTAFIGGGTNLLDLMKNHIEQPTRIVDINGLGLDKIDNLADGGIRIGAAARNSDMAAHADIRAGYPLLVEAIVAGASQQLRNMATAGGNLLQRTRCHYFVDPAFERCNKRLPGSGCAALNGEQRQHAIFGASDLCIATNPSDMNVALAALEASIRVQGARGERSIPIAQFHRLPGDRPDVDSTLADDELILSIDLPANRFSANSHYLKIRDRASYAFALVSVAAALEIDNGIVKDARIAIGGVAHKPWRATAVEQHLMGRRLDGHWIREASKVAVEGARSFPGNAFKLTLVPKAIERAVLVAGGVS
jgi:xanthine dehydrogenase YagS FAD-binding subunit